MTVTVFALAVGEQVGCVFCHFDQHYETYTRGQAFLAGADHGPCDGNANYVCVAHLERDVEIVDLYYDVGDEVHYRRRGRMAVTVTVIEFKTKRVRVQLPSGITRDVKPASIGRHVIVPHPT